MWVWSPATPPTLRLAPRLPPASRPRHRLCPVPEGPSPKPPRDLLPLLLVPAQASPRHRGPASFTPFTLSSQPVTLGDEAHTCPTQSPDGRERVPSAQCCDPSPAGSTYYHTDT